MNGYTNPNVPTSGYMIGTGSQSTGAGTLGNASGVERIPLIPAGAEPLVFLARRPAAEWASDTCTGGIVALLFLKLAIQDR